MKNKLNCNCTHEHVLLEGTKVRKLLLLIVFSSPNEVRVNIELAG